VVEDLIGHDHHVFAFDMAPSREPRAPFTRVELTDYGQVAQALTAVDDRHSGLDAVVHLAAIPAPGLVPDAALFANNLICTYNVFTAARAAGIRTVVWASSETLLGLPFETPPPYLPVDEEYAARPETSYSLAKHLEETMAIELCRWNPALTMVGLRFSNVMEPTDYAAFPGFDADAKLRAWNLWSYIDARDGAQAVRKALAYQATGAHVFIIANADTVMSRPNAELVAEIYPDVPVRRDLGVNDTMLAIDKARRELGYEPQHSWRLSDG
jgi:nucleoside-diphosphate-sugar epimerase